MGKFLVFDARNKNEVAGQVKCHDGPKAQKNCWLTQNVLMTSGFNRQAEREYAIWDMRKFDEAVARAKLGTGAGVGHLYANWGHGLVYVAGRGDMGIGLWQYSPGVPNQLLFLSESLAASPTKCFSMMPRWCTDVNKHEVDRGVRLTNDKFMHYIAYTLVNRTGIFQEDIYPPFPGAIPNSNHDTWIAGEDKPPIMD